MELPLSPGNIEDFLFTDVIRNFSLDDINDLICEDTVKNFSTLKKIIKNGFDVNQNDEWGNTLLIMSSYDLTGKSTKFLLDNGANIDHSNGDGTALFYCSVDNNQRGMKILLDHRADIGIDRWDDTLPPSRGLVSRIPHPMIIWRRNKVWSDFLTVL